ncbi:MAG TPA: threonine synthase [Actinophytocola sp.]|uniref:threonine synthase n=1 Tax=Actinophytocola sp. TaxID=1872138 RepID=UPI002DDD3F6E|nr:threonine synthase [Actinophytocola sp.]HEV2783040.1 threonine synthase [Actinophytocola sp.]
MNLPDLKCSVCAKNYPVNELVWRCSCGGVLDVVPFTEPLPDRNTLAGRGATLWRYAEALPVPADSAVSMGEGMSPLVPAPDLPGAWIKLDFLMPTLSFKDRGAAVLATLAKLAQPKRLMIDSSGNAGTAVAAYAARVDLPCDVYVPAHTSPGKLAQMRAHGAAVHLVEGTREDTAEAAAQAAAEPGVCYASHVYHPYFLHGTKTYAYELWEQLGEPLRTVVVPVGNGTLLLGAYLGFRELVEQGLLPSMPTIVGVQAAECAPLAGAIHADAPDAVRVRSEPTIAEGIAIAAPARGAQILAAVRATGGTIVTVTDAETAAARADLAARGFFVEPTSAVCWAALVRARSGPAAPRSDPSEAALRGDGVVIPLCGAGLKSTK